MAVFRIEKTHDYTVMSNHHLRNTSLSLKAKGLLSLMLSLPDNWDYTTKGLAKICKDGIDSICSTVNELEQAGYIIRERRRNDKGQLKEVEYTILEQPKTDLPKQENPVLGNPILEKPEQACPKQENPAQLNTNISNTEKSNTDLSNTYPIKSHHQEAIGYDTTEAYRNLVKENIEYEILVDRLKGDAAMLDEIVDLITETVCTQKSSFVIAGDVFPSEIVKSKLLKLNSEHIEYVIECMKSNTSKVRNIKKYLLAALFNAPSTMDSYYTARVNHDLYGGGD